MICYQVSVQFAFDHQRPLLLSTHIKKQDAPAFLVLSALPFGQGRKTYRFFHTEQEAAQYVSYLHVMYKDRTLSSPAHSGSQLSLF
jgi:hypothetical protein